MAETFITAEIFQNSHDAHLFKSQLESEGIEAIVNFDNSAGNGFLEAAGISGIHVKIREKDKEAAAQVFQNFRSENQDYYDHLNSSDIVYDGKRYMPWSGYCPNCDYDKIYMRKGSWARTILAVLTLGAATVLFFGFRNKLCTSCDHQWKD